MERIQIAFYINPHTGEITLPKDDAEREAWCEKTRQLAADGRNERLRCPLEGSQTVGGVTLSLERLGFDPTQHYLYIRYTIGGLYCPPEAGYTVPHIYMDGVELEGWDKEGSIPQRRQSSGWKATEHLPRLTTGKATQAGIRYRLYRSTCPIHSRFGLYGYLRRDAEYNRVFIGSFDITTTVHKADIVPGDLWD